MPGVLGMTHNSPMGVFQLVRVTPPSGGSDVLALQASRNAEPRSFEQPGQRPLYLGAADIVELALRMRDDDYKPTEVAVADTRFQRLEPAEVEDEVRALIDAIKTGDEATLHAVLAEQFDNLIVEAITLQGVRSHRGAKLRLLQDGRFEVINTVKDIRPDEEVRKAVLAS